MAIYLEMSKVVGVAWLVGPHGCS